MGKTWKDKKDLYTSVRKPNARPGQRHDNKKKKRIDKLSDEERRRIGYDEDEGV